ncbi:hypothetical protein ACFLWS_01715 [Chloroflexota bacterium]
MSDEEFNNVLIGCGAFVVGVFAIGLLWQWLDNLYQTNIFLFALALIGIIGAIVLVGVFTLWLIRRLQ